ncbi:hypothetical protein GCM10007852_18190 [Agaribacter marinus]|uniref:Uncharacterized protein n=2 Tax=Agaribacter marinus TaxID=1431249 RepID=A0AA37SWD9_9ALTE|nr:hypothetical protein GCM10007852_18190 [Agaribacter marinus]
MGVYQQTFNKFIDTLLGLSLANVMILGFYNHASIFALTSNTQSQTDIFHLSAKYPNFAELSNALYEREIERIASSNISDPSLIKRKLKGLTYHIKNATTHLLEDYAPMNVDVHNGTWQAKQAGKCPIATQDTDRTIQWFGQNARYGAVVAVYIEHLGEEHIELDSIDRIASDRLHLNQFGWFSKTGEYFDIVPKQTRYQLLKPTKNVLIAACGGHRWTPKGKAVPRALSLRELLLSTDIDWKTFK